MSGAKRCLGDQLFSFFIRKQLSDFHFQKTFLEVASVQKIPLNSLFCSRFINMPICHQLRDFWQGGNVERGFMLLARCAAMVQILAGQDEGRAGILQPRTAGLLGYFVDLIDIFILCRRSRC